MSLPPNINGKKHKGQQPNRSKAPKEVRAICEKTKLLFTSHSVNVTFEFLRI